MDEIENPDDLKFYWKGVAYDSHFDLMDRLQQLYQSGMGNGRMGRLWQSLILARWNPLFANIPVESLVFAHQAEYYQALQESTHQTNSAPFIAFVLKMILYAVTTPQVAPQVGRLLTVMQGEMTRESLQNAIALQDRKSFRERYLRPALADGLIEMTIPDKPNSPLQQYRLTEKGRRWLQQLE